MHPFDRPGYSGASYCPDFGHDEDISDALELEDDPELPLELVLKNLDDTPAPSKLSNLEPTLKAFDWSRESHPQSGLVRSFILCK